MPSAVEVILDVVWWVDREDGELKEAVRWRSTPT
jgi:hypothetical protein